LADIAVVGAGLGGLASAARLAKLGHRVTIFERGDAPGGLLGRVRHKGLVWDATPMQTTIPAVLRDLFRKSGRPLERYVDLELSTPSRRHVFGDGTTLDLPTGSRGTQLDVVSDAMGAIAGQAWTQFVDGQADVWTLLRSDVLDRPDGVAALTERRLARALNLKQSLDHLLRKTFDDDRLRQLAQYPTIRTGGSALTQPALRSVEPYVERTFGVWRSPGGAADLAQALVQRMDERSVEVRFGVEVATLCTTANRVTGLQLYDGTSVDADIVVTAVSPRQVFSGLLDHPVARDAVPLFTPASTTPSATVTYLGLADERPALPAEVVLHGTPLVIVATDAVGSNWTVATHGRATSDPLDTMAERGLDIRNLVTARVDRPHPTSRAGWADPRTAVRRAGFAQPLPGLHCLGTGLVLGSTVPYVAWQAAHVAERIGKA
jgi:phytoene dehydrogenase-like protein